MSYGWIYHLVTSNTFHPKLQLKCKSVVDDVKTPTVAVNIFI